MVRRRKFKVVLDAGNGAGSVAGVKLLKAFGCQVIPLFCDTSRPFQRSPEPTAENLTRLRREVRKNKADLGFALDSDSDRLAVISEQGQPIGEETTLALAIKYLVNKKKRQRPVVVVNLSTTQAIEDITRAAKGKVIRTKVGEVHVAEKLKTLKGLIGGEGNGGIIYPRIGFNRDSLTGMALILKYLTEAKQSLSQLAGQVPSYYSIKKKIKCQDQKQADKLIVAAKRRFKKKDLVLTEGVKAVLPQGWVHVRASNTEPIVRIIAEGRSRQAVEALVKQVS